MSALLIRSDLEAEVRRLANEVARLKFERDRARDAGLTLYAWALTAWRHLDEPEFRAAFGERLRAYCDAAGLIPEAGWLVGKNGKEVDGGS